MSYAIAANWFFNDGRESVTLLWRQPIDEKDQDTWVVDKSGGQAHGLKPDIHYTLYHNRSSAEAELPMRIGGEELNKYLSKPFVISINATREPQENKS